MHLYIVRHGECYGQVDPALGMDPDTALTPQGEQQAALAGQRLAEWGVSRILSSPLARALSSAAIIARAVNAPRFAVWHELRELWEPVWLPRDHAAMEQQFPYANFPAAIAAHGWQHGDASYAAAWARARGALERLQAEEGPDARVALITHGGFANYLLHILLQLPPAQPAFFDLANGAISHVHLVPPEAREVWPPLYPGFAVEVLAINDRRHLKGALSA